MIKVSNTKGLKIDGQSWVQLSIDNCPANVETAFLVIERRGEKEPFLSELGWQASEDSNARLRVEIKRLPDSGCTLLLSPSIVRNLEKANYTFHLITESPSSIAKFVYNWRGLAYIPTTSPPIEEPARIANPAPDRWSFGGGTSPPDPWVNPIVKVPIPVVTPKEPPEEKPISEALDDAIFITCLNPSCRQQIFLSNKKCPFCQVSRI